MTSPAAAEADFKSSHIGAESILDHAQNLSNPGSYEELHKKTKEVFPMIFEGFKFQLNKMISNHFQVNHTINMSSATPSGYKFGATYIGTNQVTPAEVYPIILGDIDSTGNMNAQIIHQLHPNVKSRLIAQIQEGVLAAYQLTNDYKAKNFTASVTAVNTDIVQNSGVILAHYLHRVSSNLDLGTELLFQYGRQVPNNRVAFYSVGWRYFGNQWQLSGALNPLGSLHLCYHHQSKSPIQFGVEMEANMRTMECVSTFGYQIDLSKSNVVFRGQVDSNWNVGAVMEKRLLPLPFSFTMSGYLNHVKSTYKFGIGLVIG